MRKNMKDNIKLVRLTSGEELIANVDESDSNKPILKDAIIMIPAGEGKIGFMPWVPYTKANDGLPIRHEDIMFMVDPLDELKNQFVQARSGIVTPPKGVITS